MKPDKRLRFNYFSFNHFAALEDYVSRTSSQPSIGTPIHHHWQNTSQFFGINDIPLPLCRTTSNHGLRSSTFNEGKKEKKRKKHSNASVRTRNVYEATRDVRCSASRHKLNVNWLPIHATVIQDARKWPLCVRLVEATHLLCQTAIQL